MDIPGIGSWLTQRVLLTPDKEAVVDGDQRLSYARLNWKVNRLANAMSQMGLKYGDRVGVLSYNRIEFLEIIMASAKLGLLLVPLNWRLTPPELAFNLNDSQTEIILFDPEFTGAVKDLKKQVSLKHAVCFGTEAKDGHSAYEDLLADAPKDEPIPDTLPSLNSPHIIMYTAGTTGKPKGAVLSQGTAFWNAVNLNIALDFTSRDRNLLVLPMFHIGGIGLFTLPMLYAGGTVILQRTFDPLKTLDLLVSEDISLFFGVPAVFLALIQHPDFKADAFDRVRLVMSGGAPMPVSLIKQYHQAGILLQQGFGMSEAAPSIATLSKDLALKKAGSIGRAVFHLEAKIVDDDMQEIPRGEVGELVIRGPNLMTEYWNRKEATQDAFAGGWFHTGDLARMDEDGDLYIVERKKDMFISGGENVYPAEVENAIFEMSQVAEAAVIGVPDKKWGEVGRAVVALKADQILSADDIVAHLQNRLAKFKIPRQIEFVDQLPRNAAGKVLKTELRKKA
jgi:fatty-acyl-CoA synthase